MKLKNKIFLIIISFVLLFIAVNFNNIVFGASNITFSGYCDNVDYTVPDFDFSNTLYDYNNGYIIYKNDDGSISMSIYASNDGFCYNNGLTDMIVSATSLYLFNLDLDNNKWVYTDTKIKGQYNFSFVKWNRVLYFSKDIYSNGDATSIYKAGSGAFFHQAVVLVKGVEELPGVIAETMKVIIPVGLIVLAVILLIYLIKRVIYLSH